MFAALGWQKGANFGVGERIGTAGGSGGAGLESSIVGIAGKLVGIAVPVSVGRAVRRGVGVSVAGGRICVSGSRLQARLMPIRRDRPIKNFG